MNPWGGPGTAVSVVVRARNEAQHLGSVFAALHAQRTSRRVEIVAVDSRSDDGSRELATQWADVCIDIDRYRPGLALNTAVAQARGDVIAVVSGHAIPSDERWLERLLAPSGDPGLVGIYGSQRYCDHAEFLDKKDLDIFRYGPDRVEHADADFWNANSCFTRQAWTTQPFDEQVFELEDHHWTKEMLPRGHHVRYTSSAAVYHYGHYRRNDRVLPGCEDTPEAIDAAIAVLHDVDASWPARMDAVLRIKTLADRIDQSRVVDRLCTLLRDDPDFDVRWRVADSLSRFGDPHVAECLGDALTDRSFYVRDEAAWSLARLGRLGAATAARRAPCLPAELRHLAALALGRSGVAGTENDAAALVGDIIAEAGPGLLDALYVAGELSARPNTVMLAKLIALHMTSPEPTVARTACWAIGTVDPAGTLCDTSVLGQLARHHHDAEVRSEAVTATARAMRAAPSTWAEATLRAAAVDPVGAVRFSVVHGLRLLAEADRHIPVAAEADDPDFGVRFESSLLAAERA